MMCTVAHAHAEVEVAVVLKIVGHVSKGLAYAWRRWGKHFCAQNSHIVKHFISKTLFLVVNTGTIRTEVLRDPMLR